MVKHDALQAGRNLLIKNARCCWVPEIVKTANECRSHYFGTPWLATHEAWPCILGQPALFVLQLDLALLPSAIRALVGDIGLLQFFYQPDEGIDIDWSNGTEQLGLVRIIQTVNETGGVRKQPVINGHSKRPVKLIGGWQERQDYLHSEEYSEAGIENELDELANESGLYDEDFYGDMFALQGDKLGGWPFWSQAVDYPVDSSGEPMVMLYQIDAGCFYDGPHVKAHAKNLFADDGTGHIFVSKNNPSELIFSWATG